VAVLELFALDSFVARAEHLRFGEEQLIALHGRLIVLLGHPVFQLPQLDDTVVRGEKLQSALFGLAQELQRVDLLVELQTLQMIELGFV